MAQIPEKLFFKIGEVAKITGIKPYILRYWESEFSIIRPEKNKTGQRVYRKKDVEKILEIKRLLYEEGYTISGAKKKILSESRKINRQLTLNIDREELYKRLIYSLKNDLISLSSLLKKK